MIILIALLFIAASANAQIPASITTHSDTIPIYGSTPTIEAVQDGEWSDLATWNQARVPNASDAVHIPAGRTIHGAGQLAALDLVVEGNLTLDGGFDLPVRTITVLPTGDLKILQSGTIAIRDTALDTNYDPGQFGHGLLVIDGALTIAAASPRQTWATLAEEIEAQELETCQQSCP